MKNSVSDQKKWIFQNLRYDYHNPSGGKEQLWLSWFDPKTFWDHSLSLWDNLKKSKVREDLFISVAVIAENPLNKTKIFKQDDFFKLS